MLVQECLRQGIHIFTHVTIESIAHNKGHVVGVVDALGGVHNATVVINSSGIGIRALLQGINSVHQDAIVTRLGSAVAIKNKSLDRVIVSTDFKGCNLAPANDGYMIVIIYGANQPWVDSDRDFCVIGAEYEEAIAKLQSTFVTDLYDVSQSWPYSATKTEFVDRPGTDQWGVHPGYYIIDHKVDGIAGLYTCLPGKLTLAFHATRDLMSKILKKRKKNMSLELSDFMCHKHQSQQKVAKEPWKI